MGAAVESCVGAEVGISITSSASSEGSEDAEEGETVVSADLPSGLCAGAQAAAHTVRINNKKASIFLIKLVMRQLALPSLRSSSFSSSRYATLPTSVLGISSLNSISYGMAYLAMFLRQ